jgi:Right handed beta helix region
MNAYRKLLAKALRVLVPGILVLLCSPGALRAQQFLYVDCSGTNQYAYPSINAALSNAGPGTSIFVTGTCNESVSLFGQNAFNLGAFTGQTATINGGISINKSENVFLYGLNVTNPSGDGIVVGNSGGIVLDNCTSTGNAGVGLNVGGMSDVTVSSAGAFDYNARGGMSIGGNSIVQVFAWGGVADISNNGGPGIWVSQGNFSTFGSTTVANNLAGAGSNSGFGLDLRGGAHVQFGAFFGPNHISGNQAGGASLQETAEISFFSIGQPNFIQGNGPVGVLVGFGSQATFADISGPLGAQISGHSSAGVDLYANSQAYFLGANIVQNNGSSADARSAGIRVDGNSEAFLRGGQVSLNSGPGVLVLVNSSADFSGVSFSGNGGVISCDSSSTMVSDLVGPSSTPPAGVSCRTPHGLGGRQITKTQPSLPDWSAQKAQHDRYVKLAVKH